MAMVIRGLAEEQDRSLLLLSAHVQELGLWLGSRWVHSCRSGPLSLELFCNQQYLDTNLMV